MEESDNMLITTIQQYIKISSKISSLSDIKAEELYEMALAILDYFRQDTQEIKQMAVRQQKFRSMAKLNQALQTLLQAQFQLNQLMNPTVPFLRKFLLAVINKFGQGDSLQKSKVINRNEVDNSKTNEKMKQKQWLRQEWIHPALIQPKRKYKGYLLPLTINKNMLKNNINLTHQFGNESLKGNIPSILAQTEAKLKQRVKEFEANQGFSRREYEESQIRLQNIVKINKEDWLIGDNKLQRIKKKIIGQKHESQIQAPLTSVFKQELEEAEAAAEKKQEDVKPASVLQDTQSEADRTLNPLELLKKEAENKKSQYEAQIRNILDQLKEKKDLVDQWQQQKERLEQKMIVDEQKSQTLKKQTQELKKRVQKRQNILATLEGEKDIEEQVSKLEEQIKMIEAEAKKETDRIERQIQDMENESKQKMEILGDLKIKLTKIESQFTKICDEIVEKQELKKNVKIMKSGISRLYYHKKISDMEQRWRQTEKQTKKLKINLEDVREKTRVSSTLSLRVQTEIQNLLNIEKTRNEPEIKNLRELMLKCKQAYENTMKTLEDANSIKMQTQQYEVKVHTLSGKNYKQNIERIERAIEELHRQMKDLSKSKTK